MPEITSNSSNRKIVSSSNTIDSNKSKKIQKEESISENEFDLSEDDYVSQLQQEQKKNSIIDSEDDFLDDIDTKLDARETKTKKPKQTKSIVNNKETKTKTKTKTQVTSKKSVKRTKLSQTDDDNDDDDENQSIDKLTKRKRNHDNDDDVDDTVTYTRGAVCIPTKYVFDNESIYKYQVIKRILVRWNYVMKWRPFKESPPGKEYLQLPGFPGVYVGVHGGVTGVIKDIRDHTDSPCVASLLEKPSEVLKQTWIEAIEKQITDLIKYEGEDAISLPALRFELKQARGFNSSYSDAQYKKIKSNSEYRFQ